MDIAIFIFFVAVALIASFCHGLWVLGRLIYRLFNPHEITSSADADSTTDQDRQTTRRYLRCLFYEGKIPESEFQKWMKYVEEDVPRPHPVTEPEPEPTPRSAPESEATPAPVDTAPRPESTAAEIADFLDENDFLEEPLPKTKPATPSPRKQPRPDITPTPVPAAPKRAFGSILNAFMEEKNIRWGELVSGLLIVGSAIGLVVSLWSTLKDQIPYLPALLFLLATAAIHSAGLYTFNRWKLESTSRGLLLITVLLVPLNFLAAIRLSDHRPTSDPLFILAISIGLSAFGWMVHSASRILVSFGRWQLLTAVLGTSIGQILISRVPLSEPGLLSTNLLAALPIGCFVFALVSLLRQSLAWSEITDTRARELVTLGGLSLFAVLAPCWLLVWNTTPRLETFACLTPSLSIMEIALMGIGLTLYRRKDADDAPHWSLTGSSIAIFSALMMLVNFAISWPRVEILLVLGIVNAISLTALAFKARFALCHIPALLSAGIAGLLGFHLLAGSITWQGTTQQTLIEALLLGRSAVVLLVFAVCSAVLAYLLKQIHKSEAARYYLYAAGSFSLGSSLIAVYAGYLSRTDDMWCTLALLTNSLLFLTANWKLRKPFVTALASGLCFLGLQHALCINESLRRGLTLVDLLPEAPFIWGCLIHATGGLVGLLGLHLGSSFKIDYSPAWSLRPLKGNAFTTPILFGSIVSSTMVVPYVLLQTMPAGMHALYAFWLMLIWITIALIQRSDLWFLFAQIAGTAGTLYTATAAGEHYGLWKEIGMRSPRYWVVHIIAVAIWILIGSVIHSKKYSRNLLGSLSRTARWNLQPLLLATSILVTGLVLFFSISPVIAAELHRGFDVPQIQHYAGPILVALFLYAIVAMGIGFARSTQTGIRSRLGLSLILFLLVASFVVQVMYFSRVSFGLSIAHVTEAFSYGSWICLILLGIGCTPYLNNRYRQQAIQGLLFITYLIPFLLAGHFIESKQTADALRWGLGIYALALTWITLKAETWIKLVLSNQKQTRALARLNEEKIVWRDLSMLGVCVPLLVLTLYQVLGTWLSYPAFLAPTEHLPFVKWMAGFCVPVLLLVIASVCYAIHFRSAGWMLLGSHLLAATVTLGTILTLRVSPAAFEFVDVLRISLYTGLSLSLYGLFWLMIEPEIETNIQSHQTLVPNAWPWIRIHLVTLLLLVAGPFFLPFLMNLNHPEQNWATSFPNLPISSLLSLGTAACCVQLFSRRYYSSLYTNGLSCLSLALTGYLTVFSWHHGEWTVWQSNLILITGLLLVGLFHTTRFALVYNHSESDLEQQTTTLRHLNWTQLICLALFTFAFRGAWADAYRPYPALVIAIAGTLLYFVLGICMKKQITAYASLITALLGTLFVFTAQWRDAGFDVTPQHVMDLLKWSITTAAGIASGWLVVDLVQQRKPQTEVTPNLNPAFQQIIARLLTSVVLFYSLLITVTRTLLSSTEVPQIRDLAGWVTLSAVSLLLIGLIWDRRSQYCLPALFAIGICVIATDLSTQTELRLLAQDSGLACSGYAFLISLLWSLRSLIRESFAQLSIPDFDTFCKQTQNWLPTAVTGLAVYAMAALLHSVLKFESQPMRWWSVMGTALTSLTFFAMSTHADFSLKFKKRAILAAGLAGVYCGWALLTVGKTFYWLDHLIRLLEVVSLLTLITTLILAKGPALNRDWSLAIQRSSRVFLITAGLSLLGILVSETGFQRWGIPLIISKAQIAVVSGALVLLSAALIVMAAVPKYDPFQLPLKRRMLYVYASEIVLALLFLHIYLTLPELFRGYLLPYWPYIVIAIAFAGAGVGEFFDRLGMKVLSEPLQRTGTFLPLLPALTLWMHAASIMESPVVGDYSLILLLVSLVYVSMSLWRKSFVYTTLAALAGNGALWAFWAEQGQVFTRHPQLWLIPPALSVLIATHLNRNKLSPSQLTSIRYFATIAIYISSTGDMFIAGVAENLWLPVILCGLSVFGIFAGMVLRVRAFLYVGASFLILSIVSMIWHASQSLGHIWPWWAFGIGLGICILTLFGLFEKRKNEMQNLVNQLKTWDR